MNTINFENNSIGELIRLSGSSNASAFEKLSADVKPIILNAARMYRGRKSKYNEAQSGAFKNGVTAGQADE